MQEFYADGGDAWKENAQQSITSSTGNGDIPSHDVSNATV